MCEGARRVSRSVRGCRGVCEGGEECARVSRSVVVHTGGSGLTSLRNYACVQHTHKDKPTHTHSLPSSLDLK